MSTFRKGRPIVAVVESPFGVLGTVHIGDDEETEPVPETIAQVGRISQPLSPAVEEKARVALPAGHVLPAELACTVPYNRTTGEEYKGKNIMRLLMSEAEHDWPTASGWAGFRQWVDHGRVVAKGEHSTAIVTVFTGKDGERHVGGKRVFHFAQTVELEQ